MNILKQLIFLALMMFLWVSVSAADEKVGHAATPGPTIVSEARFPIIVEGREYYLINRIMEFPAGAGNPNHMHGGHVLHNVLTGELTLREKGTEKIFKAGESWIEYPGNDVHAVVNAGIATARISAVFLVPKGAEATIMVK